MPTAKLGKSIVLAVQEWSVDQIDVQIDAAQRDIDGLKAEIDALKLVREARQILTVPTVAELRQSTPQRQADQAERFRNIETVLSYLHTRGSADERQIRNACNLTRAQLDDVVKHEPTITVSGDTGTYWIRKPAPAKLDGEQSPQGVITPVATSIEAEVAGDGTGVALPPIEDVPEPAGADEFGRFGTRWRHMRLIAYGYCEGHGTSPLKDVAKKCGCAVSALIQCLDAWHGGKLIHGDGVVAISKPSLEVRSIPPTIEHRTPAPSNGSMPTISIQDAPNEAASHELGTRRVTRPVPKPPDIKPLRIAEPPANPVKVNPEVVCRYLRTIGPQSIAIIATRCNLTKPEVQAAVAADHRLKISSETGLVHLVTASKPLPTAAGNSRKLTPKRLGEMLGIYLEAAGPSAVETILRDVGDIDAQSLQSLVKTDGRFVESTMGLICLRCQLAGD